MAIIQKIDTSKTILDEKTFEVSKTPDALKLKQKKGIIRSTFAELRLVQWPTIKHTLTWATTVVLFALVLTIFVGGLDKVFKSGFEYATCTAKSYKDSSSTNKSEEYNQCGKLFGQSLTTFN